MSKRTRPYSRTPVRVALSYHRLRSAAARRIVAHTRLTPSSLVVEAGAGEGVLTEALVATGSRIIAVERDRELWEQLKARFACSPRITPVLDDIRSVRLPIAPYVFIANVPFSISADVLRTVLFGNRPPVRASLVLERDAALHWAGVGWSSLVSVLAHARWEIDIPCALRREDFVPRPSVDCVLLVADRRSVPLVPRREQPAFERFVRTGFGRGRRDLRHNLRGVMGHRAFRNAAAELGFDIDALPSELSPAQWVQLFARTRPRGSTRAP